MTVSEVVSPAGEGSGEPFLSTSADTVYLSWLQEGTEGVHELRVARRVAGGWGEPVVVAAGNDFFVNWADFPSVEPGPAGTLWAHWLQRGGEGGYDYGVRVSVSRDGGATWSEPLRPHEDTSPQEHGFVSLFPVDGGMGAVWLDGRLYEAGPDGGPPTQEMTLRYRLLTDTGSAAPVAGGPEVLLDARACDCCQTAAVQGPQGPVVFYRDRSEAEIRDIYVTRRVDGAWTEGEPVSRDGWEIAGCPVNGPAADARDGTVAVAWFTAPENEPRVNVAFSRDGGASFQTPFQADDGNPGGRVDLLLLADGSALLTWLERTGGESAEIRMRRVHPREGPGRAWTVTSSSSARASGFPRTALLADTAALVSWTRVDGDGPTLVRLAHVDLRSLP